MGECAEVSSGFPLGVSLVLDRMKHEPDEGDL